MMQIGSRSAFFGMVVVGLVGAATAYWQKEQTRSDLRCEWRSTNAAAYRVKTVSSARLHEGFLSGDPTRPPTQVSLSYEAQLDMHAAEGGAHKSVYVAKLRLLNGLRDREARLRTDLARPFAFEMDGDCRFGEFGFAPDEGRESRELKKSLLIVMEAVTQPHNQRQATTWQVNQTDATGDFEASYLQDSETGEIQRRRLYYSKTAPLSGSIPLKAEVVKSAASFLPSETFWLATANAQEAIRVVSEKGEAFVQSTATVNLQEVDGKESLDTKALAKMKWEGLRVDESIKMTSSRYDKLGDQTLAMATATLVEALDAFTKGDFYSGKIDREAVGNMVHFLRGNPAAIQGLLDKIKTDQLDKRLHAFLFFTLTKVGTPAAQSALISAMGDAEHTEENRMQAMHALADVENPISESVEALIGMAKPFSLDLTDENNLESTALLALGVVERHQLGGASEELGKRASDALLDRLKSDVGEQEKAVLVEALGNTGNPKHSRMIIDQFNDGSALVRVSAARALSRMSLPDSDQALMDAVQRETAADTRREIATAWAQKGGQTGSFDTAKAVDMLARESQENIRLSLIDVLGREAASQPMVKAALARQYAQETSHKVKYAIGKYLSADDLTRGSAGR